MAWDLALWRHLAATAPTAYRRLKFLWRRQQRIAHTLLEEHVDPAGWVDYAGLADDPASVLGEAARAVVGVGRDHTLFAKADGQVKFETKGPKSRKFVSVDPA